MQCINKVGNIAKTEKDNFYFLDKEIRVSLKLIQAWNASLGNNLTKPYAMFSGVIEQAVSKSDSPGLFKLCTTGHAGAETPPYFCAKI